MYDTNGRVRVDGSRRWWRERKELGVDVYDGGGG